MKDYFGNEIHIGDTILFSGRNSRGYRASFDECVVTKFKGKAKVRVDSYYYDDYRMTNNVINLTALGLRQRSGWNEDKWDWEDIKEIKK
jgi:hypothetical protein